MVDEKTAVPPQPSRPRPIRQAPPPPRPPVPEKKDRTPFWILVAVMVGFMLPVCSCGVLILSRIDWRRRYGNGGWAGVDQHRFW